MTGSYNRKDRFYNMAKSEGYRSRAAFKLLEIDQKYHFLRPGARVLDLGCWPGGWTQVACRIVGPNGTVVGVDLKETDEFTQQEISNGCQPVLLTGDLTTESVQQRICEIAPDGFDVVISDLSPKLSGIRFADVARSAELVELVLGLGIRFLRVNGNLITKFFPGSESEVLFRQYKKHFTKIIRVNLEASRKTSTEQYFLGLKYRQ